MAEHQPHNPGGADALYERRDVSVRGIALAAALVAAGFVLAMLLTWLVLRLATGVADTYLPLFPEAPDVPAPALQVDPQQDLAEFRDNKLERLTSYGWVDRSAGVIHVPIEDAMARVAKDGLPRWAPAERADAATTAHRARQRALERQEETP